MDTIVNHGSATDKIYTINPFPVFFFLVYTELGTMFCCMIQQSDLTGCN